MACNPHIKVFISDRFIEFPYGSVVARQDTRLTIFVPTFADEKVIIKNLLDFQQVHVLKYASGFEEDASVKEGVVVYWNVITPIKVTGVGDTLVFNVVLSDNLYSCNDIKIDNDMKTITCPLQVDYNVDMVCLKGEYAGDAEELKKAGDESIKEFFIHFDKHTPMGIKILNTKRFLIALGRRTIRARISVYLPYEELTTIHKELTWESTRRRLRGGTTHNNCNIINRPSYKYILDALELLGIATDDAYTIHRLVDIFTPLILRYKLVPDVFVELNNINGEEKHVRLYCKYEGVTITNAGPVPLNMTTRNPVSFSHNNTPALLPEQFYHELGTRNVFVHTPLYNYFL
ncbi:ODV-EC43 [Diatraea saccharalis granulovirus]|uniref:ODV-EC43 n=1 Tax=Diatraea saccharalis granulovirus TaxID=1675862 RepID=A0A0R7EYQ7_9BBAC|nr:ODV-EC43 [Diatraea saccharalis granulovirus]AKN80724.1 ODV-EC43 [Diatraea saccharalis granulovirus]